MKLECDRGRNERKLLTLFNVMSFSNIVVRLPKTLFAGYSRSGPRGRGRIKISHIFNEFYSRNLEKKIIFLKST